SRTSPARTSAVSRSIRPSNAFMTSNRSSASLRASAGVDAGSSAGAVAAGAGLAWACRFISSTSVSYWSLLRRLPLGASRPIGRSCDLLVALATCWSRLRCCDLLGAAGLLQNEGAIDVIGNSDAAGLGERFRVLLGQHR